MGFSDSAETSDIESKMGILYTLAGCGDLTHIVIDSECRRTMTYA